MANALEVLGDRWTLLVIRDLFTGKHEFREFLNGPEKVATNILSDRLKRLMCQGIIAFAPHPGHKSMKRYYLTKKGKDLMPLMVELIRWGGTYQASPEMPRAVFEAIDRAPGKFMRDTLRQLAVWEKANLTGEARACC